MRRVLAPSLALLTFALAMPARGADERLRLTWSAPAGCPSAEEVSAQSLALASSGADAGVLEADARVEERRLDGAPSSWRVHLRTRRGEATGEREIEASSCAGIAEATAVVLALAFAPPGAAQTAARDPRSAPSERRPTTAPTATDRDAPPRAATNGGRRLALGAAVAGDASTLPSVAVGGALSLAWTPERFRLEIDARRWATQARSVTGSEAGARFTLTSIGARACLSAARGGAFELAPCAGGDLHLAETAGYGADANYDPVARWGTVTGGALGRFSITPWLALRLRAEAVVPLARPTFVVEGEGTVHRAPPVGAAGSFGLEAHFL